MRKKRKLDWEKSKNGRKEVEKVSQRAKKSMPKKPGSVISQTNFHSKWNLLSGFTLRKLFQQS